MSRMRGAIPPLPQNVFVAWCLVKQGDNFSFYLLHASYMPAHLILFDLITLIIFSEEKFVWR
jgi:hypothetical protein